jgi:hypothetical protein
VNEYHSNHRKPMPPFSTDVRLIDLGIDRPCVSPVRDSSPAPSVTDSMSRWPLPRLGRCRRVISERGNTCRSKRRALQSSGLSHHIAERISERHHSSSLPSRDPPLHSAASASAQP